MEDAFSILCRARLATMSELMDPAGCWSRDLVEAMLPVASLRILEEGEAAYSAAFAAIAGAFDKKAREFYGRHVAAIKEKIRGARRKTPGAPPGPGKSDAEKFIEVFKKIGVKFAGPSRKGAPAGKVKDRRRGR